MFPFLLFTSNLEEVLGTEIYENIFDYQPMSPLLPLLNCTSHPPHPNRYLDHKIRFDSKLFKCHYAHHCHPKDDPGPEQEHTLVGKANKLQSVNAVTIRSICTFPPYNDNNKPRNAEKKASTTHHTPYWSTSKRGEISVQSTPFSTP